MISSPISTVGWKPSLCQVPPAGRQTHSTPNPGPSTGKTRTVCERVFPAFDNRCRTRITNGQRIQATLCAEKTFSRSPNGSPSQAFDLYHPRRPRRKICHSWRNGFAQYHPRLPFVNLGSMLPAPSSLTVLVDCLGFGDSQLPAGASARFRRAPSSNFPKRLSGLLQYAISDQNAMENNRTA
jgi:hypothetical protein